MMEPFERAWSLLKMPPIEETDVPGLSVAYGTDEETRGTPTIGNVPYARSNESQMVPMSANEYFDYIMEERARMRRGDPATGRPPLRSLIVVPGRDADYRWAGHGVNSVAGSKENIRRIIEGIKEGMPLGAPELHFHGDKPGMQEGGHRMEALRQMGHGDTRIPVAVHQSEWRHKVKDMPEGRRLPE